MDAEERPSPSPVEEAGGDPACWAALICPNCGAIPDQPIDVRPTACPTCGEPYPVDD